MTVNTFILSILLINLWGDVFIGICADKNTKRVRGIVTPNPVAIGSQMTVTCSTDSIGGASQLVELSKRRTIVEIVLSRQVSKAAYEELIKYHIIDGKCNRTQGITIHNSKCEGGGVLPSKNNVDTMKITLNVPAVTCELIAAYSCEYVYAGGVHVFKKRKFIEHVTNIIDVHEISVTASAFQPSNYDGEGHDFFFTCKVNGAQDMTVGVEVAQCSAPIEYQNLTKRDKIEVTEENSTALTQTKCYDPVREYTLKLHFSTTADYCSIRCAAYDKDGKKIEKYCQRTITFATKTPATKTPVSFWRNFLIIILNMANVIVAVNLGWYCFLKYKSSTIPDSSVKPSFTSDKPSTMSATFSSAKISTISATPEVQEASLLKKFSIAFTNFFDKSEPGLEGGRQSSPFSGDHIEEED